MINIQKINLKFFFLIIFLSTQLAMAGVSKLNKIENRVSQVELQWVICEPSIKVLFSKLDFKPEQSDSRKVYYSDTQNQDLYGRGTIIRTRVPSEKSKKIKTAVKVNYLEEFKIPWNFLANQDYKCEEDMYLQRSKIGCSVYSYPMDLNNTFSSEQAAFIQKESGFDHWNDVVLYGPAQSTVWSWSEESLDLDLEVEQIKVENQFFNIELSTRVNIDQGKAVFGQLQKWLLDHQIRLCQIQQGRTGELLNILKQN
jgi:hypothetical protein